MEKSTRIKEGLSLEMSGGFFMFLQNFIITRSSLHFLIWSRFKIYNFEKHKADKQVCQLDRFEVQFSFCFSILAVNKINCSEHMDVLIKYAGLNVSGLESMSEIYML